VRSVEGGVRTASLASFPGPLTSWTADGRSVLIGRVSPTVPAGNTFDAFGVWGAPQTQTLALLPNLLGVRSFSPDGRYFVGVSRDRVDTTRLELYRCGPWSDDEWNIQGDPDAEARLARINGDERHFVRPVAGDIAQFQTQYHSGVDLAAPVGSIITAADAGFVSAIGWAPTGVGGFRVCVNHGGGLESCYHHSSSALVGLGQRVVRGQPIALVGMTGATTGPHVHWEVKLNGKLVDPLAR
jgi:murein DD-endopeptidase MepM/ murein hydrolase activator NlpD